MPKLRLRNGVKMILFTIPGKPCAVQSVKSTKSGIHYQPANVKEWKSLVRMCAATVKPDKLMTGPVCVLIRAFFKRPEKYCTKKLSNIVVPCLIRRDCENIAKGINDAMTCVIWNDDSQIIDLRIQKFYALPDEAPYTQVFVEPATDDED